MDSDKEELLAAVVTARRGGCVIDIEVTPGCSKPGITGVKEYRNRLKVDVAAPAQKGRANKEVVKIIARALRLTDDKVTLIIGAKNHQKTVHAALDREKVIERIARCLE